MGPWKGIRLGVSKNADAPVQLFNLEKDIAETTNVADAHPDIVAKMAVIMSAGRVPSAEFPMGALDRPGVKP